MVRKRQNQTLARIKEVAGFTLQGTNQLLWPAVCTNCGENICETDNGLCKNCWNQLIVCTGADYCRRCGRDAGRASQIEGVCPDCQGKEIHFDQIARAGLYAQSLQKMIVDFKNGKTELDTILGFLADSALQGSVFRGEIEIFVPVPLHWSRRLVRGFNQSHMIIKKLKHPSVKTSTDFVRIRRTKMQTGMVSPQARAKNVAGAFAVRKGHRLSGRKICLVDDIKTTGATLNECAKTLKEAGAVKIFALVLAVAGQKM
ncbi:MAG: ComF family protein [Sedimentisphaerales bacterium]|nr:ComF family protein [Sedimentisphaerales bacterium]